jgi:glycosyltransferase involved in cell wall biosynthesis
MAAQTRSRRALLIATTSPWGESYGARQRTALFYDALAQDRAVDVLVMQEGETNEATPGDRPEILATVSWKSPSTALYRYGIHEWANNWCRAHVDFNRYDLVAGRYLTEMTKIEWPPHMLRIVDCDDAYYRYVPARPTNAAKAVALAKGWMRFWQTKTAITGYDHVFFCAARDLALFRCRSSSLLPNVVRIPAGPAPGTRGDGATVLMVGAMWYPPNRNGVEWFLRHCWEEIAARCPELTLRIVGPASADIRARWEQAPRTAAPGFVEDLAAEYANARFTIVPVHYGSGTCIKFLESGAHGKACVITDQVRAAYEPDFQDGESVVVARDARGMIDSCRVLYEDAARRSAIAKRAHDIVTRSYTIERFTQTVRDTVRSLSDSIR